MSEKKIYVTDVEGPISKNDNALELSQHFIPQGDSFFALLSKFDDYLADVKKEPDYKAGDTLRLILPFFKAFGITNASIEQFSADTLLLVPGAPVTIEKIRKLMPLFLISTSYRPYINALCNALSIDPKKAYSTELDLDGFEMDKVEMNKIKEIKERISQMPMIEFDAQCQSQEDIPPNHLKTIDSLYQIFWHTMPQLPASKSLLEKINPIGGKEKAYALENIVKKENIHFRNTIYVGDSITDVETLKLLRDNGGLPISFNGNAYPFRFAELAVISSTTQPLLDIAKAFTQGGKEAVWKLIEKKGPRGDSIYIITEKNSSELIDKSKRMRSSVRGEKIAHLG